MRPHYRTTPRSPNKSGCTPLPSGLASFGLQMSKSDMDDRMLSAIVLIGFGLSALFGSYGILMLVAAYRTGNLTAWGRLAILGGISVLLSAILADIAVTRWVKAPSKGQSQSLRQPDRSWRRSGGREKSPLL
jgi:hypothetical protein